MPVNPGDGERFAQDAARLVDQYEDALLRLLADMVRQQGTDPDLLRQARDLQRLADAARSRGAHLDVALLAKVRDLVHDAYNTGTALAIVDLQDAGRQFTAGALPVVATATVLADQSRTLYRRALDGLPQLLSAAYSEAVAAGAREHLGGSVTRLQASQHVLDRLLADGIRGFTDKAGRSWSLDTYVEMAVRTTTGQAAVQGHIDQLASAGLDLVMVSDSPRECPLCRPWEGKVLSISGSVAGKVVMPASDGSGPRTVSVAGSVADAKGAGLQHPNCTHHLSAYLPGVSRPQRSSDPEGYVAKQRQREIERRIRHWKRRQALALDDEAARTAAGKVRSWQAALREHVDAHDLKRLRYREQVGIAH